MERVTESRRDGEGGAEPGVTKPIIVCLCGSTRFYREFHQANFEETLKGKIVLSVGFFVHALHEMHEMRGGNIVVTVEQKVQLDELHKRKMDILEEGHTEKGCDNCGEYGQGTF